MSSDKQFTCQFSCDYFEGLFMVTAPNAELANKKLIETLRKKHHKKAPGNKDVFNKCTKKCSLKILNMECKNEKN